MPINITPNSGLAVSRQGDAQHTEKAKVRHEAEAGAVLKTESKGSTEVTAEVLGASGSGSVSGADPADVLARLSQGHTTGSAKDVKAFTVKSQAELELSVTAKAHSEVFATIEGGELGNAGSTSIEPEQVPGKSDKANAPQNLPMVKAQGAQTKQAK